MDEPDIYRPVRSEHRVRRPILPVVLIVALVAIAGGLYYYWLRSELETSPMPPPPVAEAPPAPEPEVRYPLQAAPEAAKPLPPLAESDPSLRETLATFLDTQWLERFNLTSIVRRFVVTVDAIARKEIAQQYSPVRPVYGKFVVSGKDENIATNPANERRYTPYVRLAETVDTKKLVAAYVYLYPLFQEEYQNLGYPKKYFNDRVVEAIDNLLAAPDVKGPIKLVQPKVFYQFADPSLESLSAGQKIMIRMGADNAARLKAKLREIRREITTPR